jgi:hypothetical protein
LCSVVASVTVCVCLCVCVCVCVCHRYRALHGKAVLPYLQFQFLECEVLVIKKLKVCASRYIHTVVGHLVSRPWGPGGGTAAPSRNLVQDFPHRVHREMGANPCPQTEAGPTPPEGWGGGSGRRQVHNPTIYTLQHALPNSSHVLPVADTCPWLC